LHIEVSVISLEVPFNSITWKNNKIVINKFNNNMRILNPGNHRYNITIIK